MLFQKTCRLFQSKNLFKHALVRRFFSNGKLYTQIRYTEDHEWVGVLQDQTGAAGGNQSSYFDTPILRPSLYYRALVLVPN